LFHQVHHFDYAKHLLETNFKSIRPVCYEVGCEDVPFFRNVFRRRTGLTPKEYRQRFGRRYRHDDIAANVV